MTKQKNHITWKNESEELYVLNLDQNFDPFADYFNGIFKVNFSKGLFPAGEPNFKIESSLYNGNMVITHRINSVSDLIDIVIANDAVRRMGVKNIELFIPYFPAARQDRICNTGEAFTLKIFADMINSCGFDKVSILCPHSDVTPALINNVHILDEREFMLQSVLQMSNGKDVNIVCPDAGAGKRVQKIIEYLSNQDRTHLYHLVRCEKIRDVKDGSLKEFYVGEGLVEGAPTLIIDDINCKGGTFLGLAEKLKEKKCGSLGLFTTHSDCQEGVENVSRKFDFVFTTNSKQNWSDILKFADLTTYKIKY
jgi:ribose-phosphate pyrophosphokinase